MQKSEMYSLLTLQLLAQLRLQTLALFRRTWNGYKMNFDG